MSRVELVVRETFQDAIPIERVLPVFERYADIFDTPITVYVPEDSQVPTSIPGRVSVHFLSPSNTANIELEPALNSVLGYKSSVPLRRFRKKYSVCSPNYTNHFYDFSGYSLAHAASRSIFIDFDFFRDSWNGQEDVLSLILHALMAYIFSGESLRHAGSSLARLLKEEFGADRENKKAAFRKEAEALFSNAVASYTDNLQQSANELAVKESELISLKRAMWELEEYIAREDNRQANDEMFNKEFDEILRQKGVGKIEIDEHSITVLTTRLEQLVPLEGDWFRKTPHDIGSFSIYISRDSHAHHGISVYQRARGEFVAAFTGSNICFGSNTQTGFNVNLDKMMADRDISAVITLVLTFLIVVNSRPAPTARKLDEEERLADMTVDFPEAEKEEARGKYVAMMHQIRGNDLRSQAKRNLNELGTKENRLSAQYSSVRVIFAERRAFLAHVKNRLSEIAQSAGKNFDELSSRQEVRNIEVRGGIRIWIYNDGLFYYPALLWFEPNSFPRIFWSHLLFGVSIDHSGSFPEDLRESIMKDLIKGDLGRVLNAIIPHISKPAGEVHCQ